MATTELGNLTTFKVKINDVFTLYTPNLTNFCFYRSENGLSVNLPEAIDFSRLWLPASVGDWVVFKARACSDVRVCLSSVSTSETADRYEVILGANGNTRCSLWKLVSGRNHDESEIALLIYYILFALINDNFFH